MPPVTRPDRLPPSTPNECRGRRLLDGELCWEEWPHAMLPLDRESSRWGARGAPIFARVGYDNRNLYVAVNVAMFDVTRLRKGSAWGVDDGVEVSIAGPDATYVFRGFVDGTVSSLPRAGLPVKFAVRPFGTAMGGWRAEWAISLETIGLKPAPGVQVAFNIAVFRAADQVLRQLEGTLAESSKVDQAARLQF